MGSGGGGQQTTTQRTVLPAWAQPFAKEIFGQAAQTYFPGGHLLPAEAGVAGFSPDQLAAMQMTEQLSGVAPNAGQNYINWNAGPGSNYVGPPQQQTGKGGIFGGGGKPPGYGISGGPPVSPGGLRTA